MTHVDPIKFRRFCNIFLRCSRWHHQGTLFKPCCLLWWPLDIMVQLLWVGDTWTPTCVITRTCNHPQHLFLTVPHRSLWPKWLMILRPYGGGFHTVSWTGALKNGVTATWSSWHTPSCSSPGNEPTPHQIVPPSTSVNAPYLLDRPSSPTLSTPPTSM